MNAHEQAFSSHFAQITTNGVLGNTKFLAEFFGHELPILLEAGEQQLLAVGGEHGASCTMIPGIARRCMIPRGVFLVKRTRRRLNVIAPTAAELRFALPTREYAHG